MARSVPAIVLATIEAALENALAAGHAPDVAIEWAAKVTRVTWPESDAAAVRAAARKRVDTEQRRRRASAAG
jgi:hypothetical protein